MPGAVRQLEDLGEELDVDQPAGAELEVDAPGALPAQLRFHAAADVVDLRALAGGEPRPEDARLPERHESASQQRVAQNRARPDERLALPERRLVREIAVERPKVVGERRPRGRPVVRRVERTDTAP